MIVGYEKSKTITDDCDGKSHNCAFLDYCYCKGPILYKF